MATSAAKANELSQRGPGVAARTGSRASVSARLPAVWRELLERVRRRWLEAHPLALTLVVAGLIAGLTLPDNDVPLYEKYATAALRAPLFHSMPTAYPAASLIAFLAPRLLPVPYAVGFALLAAVVAVALVLCTDGVAECLGWSRRTCTYLLLASVWVIFARYDLLPVLAATLAVEGARKQRWGRSWAWAVTGGLLKLFPFLLLPGFLIVERAQTGKWALRRLLAGGSAVALCAGIQQWVAPGSLLSPLNYEVNRGFELASFPGSLSLLLAPSRVRWSENVEMIQISGPGHAVASMVLLALAIGALGFVWLEAARGRLNVQSVSLAVLTIAVLADKTFAPQYLIWLIPLWAYWPLRRGWLAAAALTTLVYPLLYVEANQFGPGYYLPTSAALVRNVVLLAATALWLRGELREASLRKGGFVTGRRMVPLDVQLPTVTRPGTVGALSSRHSAGIAPYRALNSIPLQIDNK